MKRVSLAALVIALIGVGTAKANFLVTVKYVPGYYTAPGGEFNVSPVVGGGYAPSVLVGNGFESFCLELDENISPYGGGTTYDAVVNPFDDALNGGGNSGAAGPDGGDPISLGTAYLYSQFAKGVLSGYSYTQGASRQSSAWALQNAIWWLEDETDPGSGITTASTAAAGAPFLSLVPGITDNQADANGAYGVHVLNLYGLNPTTGQYDLMRQDQLFLPDGGSTLILLGMALGGFGLLSRKLRKA